MMKRFMSVFILSFGMVGAASAIDIDITDHPDRSYMLGYETTYKPDCDVRWWASRWDTEHIIGTGECDGITEDTVFADLNRALIDVKADPIATDFTYYYALQEIGGAANRLPKEYWDFMDGYKYEYGNSCTVRWANRTSTFVTFNCERLNNEKLKADAIKSIEYVKANSNAKNFYEYYRNLDSRNDANHKSVGGNAKIETEEDRTRGMISAWGEGQEIAVEACAARLNKKPITLKEIQKNHKHISSYYAQIIFNRTNRAFDRRGWGLDCLRYSNAIIDNYFMRGIDLRSAP